VPGPLATDTGLPVGLQIMGPAHGDDRLYKVGAAFESGR
jgi:aspartyl-tRNA(Asn)/glutamyl-tRNA(Gln) amidotransferase subunit A